MTPLNKQTNKLSILQGNLKILKRNEAKIRSSYNLNISRHGTFTWLRPRALDLRPAWTGDVDPSNGNRLGNMAV